MSILPVNPADLFEGRPFFRILEDDSEVVLHTRNIRTLEESIESSLAVKTVISDIWNLLELPKSYIDVNLLQRVFEFTDNNSLSSYARQRGIKIAKAARDLICESVDEEINASPFERFMKSDLVLYILRDLVDLPFQTKNKSLQPLPISQQLLERMDKRFLESPLCCLHVNNVSCKIVEGHVPRSTASYEMQPKSSVLGYNINDTQIMSKCTTVYFYGQHLSSYCSLTGNFYSDPMEFKRRKDSILNRWDMIQSHNPNFKKPKWFDNYAGVADPKSAAIQLVMADASPVSKLTTLSAIKKNLIVFAYICQSILKFNAIPGSSLYTKQPTTEDFVESLLEFFYKTETTGVTCPLKRNSSGGYYMKIQENLLIPGADNVTQKTVDQLEKLGADMNKTTAIVSIKGRSYNHVSLVNGLTYLEMNEKERCALSESIDEMASLLLVPVNLTSYENTRPVFLAGMLRRNKMVYEKPLPIVVGKASLLYGKEPDVPNPFIFVHQTKDEKELQDIAFMIIEMIKSHQVDSFESACELLSVPVTLYDSVKNYM